MARTPKLRKRYFPFEFLLRSAPYQGKGALVAENCEIHDGRIRKTKVRSEWTEVADKSAILFGDEFIDSDGDIQKLVFFKDSSYYTFRAIEEDKSITVPLLPEANEVTVTGTITFTTASADVSADADGNFITELSVGDYIYADAEYASRLKVLSITDNNNLVLESNYAGAGVSNVGKRATPHFTGAIFDYEQIGINGFVMAIQATGGILKWDGTTATPSSNTPASPTFLSNDKNRLVVGQEKLVGFSERDFSTSNDYEGGAGVKSHGFYKVQLVQPKAAIDAGNGIIVVGKLGGDAQKVFPNANSDEVADDTSVEGYTYGGAGVDDLMKVCKSEDFVYLLADEGILEMNPFTGKTINLTDTGQIGRDWDDYTLTNGIIEYDPKNRRVVAYVQLGSSNDTLICVDVSDASGESRPIFTVPNSTYSSLFVSDNELFGGDSSSGKIYQVFEEDRARFHYSHEWDKIDDADSRKKSKGFSIFVNINPLSEGFRVKLSIDGSSTPFYDSGLLTVTDAASVGEDGAYEFYLFEGGLVDDNTDGVDYIKKNKARAKFSTIRFEVIEDSQYPFELLNFMIEYKAKSKLLREKKMDRV